MLTKYIQAALNHAEYEIIEDDGSYYGRIPICPGVWANAPTLEACRTELLEVLEEWILLGLHLDHTLPVIDAVNINPQKEAV